MAFKHHLCKFPPLIASQSLCFAPAAAGRPSLSTLDPGPCNLSIDMSLFLSGLSSLQACTVLIISVPPVPSTGFAYSRYFINTFERQKGMWTERYSHSDLSWGTCMLSRGGTCKRGKIPSPQCFRPLGHFIYEDCCAICQVDRKCCFEQCLSVPSSLTTAASMTPRQRSFSTSWSYLDFLI